MKQITAMVAGVCCLLALGMVQADEKIQTDLIGGQRVLIRKEAQPPGNNKAYWEVLGWGRSEKEAIQDALKRAPQVVVTYLSKHQPPILWQPTPEFIWERMRCGEVLRVPALDQVIPAGPEKVQARAYAVPIGIDHENLKLIQGQDTIYRRELQKERFLTVAQERLLILLEVLGVALLGLVAVIAYFHVRGEPKTS